MQVPDGVVISKHPCIELLTSKCRRHLVQLASLYKLADVSLLQVPFKACRKPLLLLLTALPVCMLRGLALQLLPLLGLHCLLRLLRLPSFLLLLAKPLRRRRRYVLHSLLHPTLLQPLLQLPARLTLGAGYHALLLLLLLWHARHGYGRVLLLLLLDGPCTPG